MRKGSSGQGPSKQRKWSLCLYIAGRTPQSMAAFQNLQRICREYVNVGCDIEVVDVAANPRLAITENIVALPTLIRKVPGAQPRRMIGDLSNTQKVLKGLGLTTQQTG